MPEYLLLTRNLFAWEGLAHRLVTHNQPSRCIMSARRAFLATKNDKWTTGQRSSWTWRRSGPRRIHVAPMTVRCNVLGCCGSLRALTEPPVSVPLPLAVPSEKADAWQN